MSKLDEKITRSIHLLQSIGKRYDGVIEVAYSGGKDSDVILQLAKEAGINYEAIYKNTTIDPPGTISHVQEMGATIIRPKKRFFELVEENGYPNRFYRFCCRFLKEYKVRDKAIVGVRRDESTSRANRYQEPTACRWFGAKTEKNHVEQIYPILEWTEADVRDFVQDRGLTLAPIYYRGGQIDVTQRLGCMCCPLSYYKKRQNQFRETPKMVRCYLRAGRRYLATHPEGRIANLYRDEYEWFYRDVFCTSQADFGKKRRNLFGELNYKQFLEEFLGIEL